MEDKELALLDAVKKAVTKFGISGISTRNVGDISNVNDAYIYKFFENKDDLILKAYIKENSDIFKSILYGIDKAQSLSDCSFEERAKISFDISWDNLFEDKERLIFCVSFYHSNYFSMAENYHNEQMSELKSRLGKYFASENDFKQTMYSLCSVLYDSCFSCVTGKTENTPEYANRVFETELAIILRRMNSQ